MSRAPAFVGILLLSVALAAPARADLDQGFEVDVSHWDIFGAAFTPTRVASGTNGVTSATGAWHAEVGVDPESAATDWGGYACVADCAATACAAGGVFPPGGYTTSIDVYLDVGASYANNTRVDFSSAISKPDGSHLRDFIFNGGFFDDSDGSPGSGTNRFIFSASNNSQPGSAFAKNPARFPIAIQTTGWYTFKHIFYDTGGSVLAVDLEIRNSGGGLVNSWTLSDPTDIIGSTVGGNRYGWFDFNEVPDLAADNSLMIGCPAPPQVPASGTRGLVLLTLAFLSGLALVGATSAKRMQEPRSA